MYRPNRPLRIVRADSWAEVADSLVMGGCGARLRPENLDRDLSLSRPVQLGEDDRLEAAEREVAVVDADRDAAADQRRPQVRVGVAALAVGEARIVVAVAGPLGHQALDHAL